MGGEQNPEAASKQPKSCPATRQANSVLVAGARDAIAGGSGVRLAIALAIPEPGHPRHHSAGAERFRASLQAAQRARHAIGPRGEQGLDKGIGAVF